MGCVWSGMVGWGGNSCHKVRMQHPLEAILQEMGRRAREQLPREQRDAAGRGRLSWRKPPRRWGRDPWGALALERAVPNENASVPPPGAGGRPRGELSGVIL